MSKNPKTPAPQPNKGIALYIPTPCHENWEAMTPLPQGRFCQSCAKEVVDFSLMTDQEVLNYFSKSTVNTCGRFNSDQLQRPLQPTKIEKKKTWWVAAMMPLLMMVEKATAQKKNNRVVQPGIVSQRTLGDTVIFMGKVLLPGIKIPRSISGHIVNAQGHPIPYATIKLNNKYKASADSVGVFKLTDVLSDGDNIVEVSSIGYKMETIVVSDTVDTYEIVLQEVINSLDPVVTIGYSENTKCSSTMGAVSVGVTATSFTIPKDVNLLKMLLPVAFTIYPNPAPRGSNVTISFKKEGDYIIQLFDNNGKLISISNYNADEATLQTALAIPSSLTAGVCYIQLVNAKNKKRYTSKLIVEVV